MSDLQRAAIGTHAVLGCHGIDGFAQMCFRQRGTDAVPGDQLVESQRGHLSVGGPAPEERSELPHAGCGIALPDEDLELQDAGGPALRAGDGLELGDARIRALEIAQLEVNDGRPREDLRNRGGIGAEWR